VYFGGARQRRGRQQIYCADAENGNAEAVVLRDAIGQQSSTTDVDAAKTRAFQLRAEMKKD
jgi:hypothetical protein